MSAHIPVVNQMDPDEPPPPYHVATEASYNKNHVYPSAPDWTHPPGPTPPGVTTHQPGGYPPQSEYASPPGFPQPGYVPLPQGSCNVPPPAYGPTVHRQTGYVINSQHPAQTTVIVQQPLLTPLVQSFQDRPVQTVCPKCQASVVTLTFYENGTLNWLLCAVICLIGCDAGCCLIPFCIDSCKDVVHICPNCQQQISRFNRL